jgi:excisionase family DNA binding protein
MDSDLTAAPSRARGRLLTVDEVSDELRISRSKTYELISGGTLPSVTIGRNRRVTPEQLDRFVEVLSEVPTANQEDTAGPRETRPACPVCGGR